MSAAALFGSMDTEEIAALVFLDIAVIVIVARAMGSLFRRIRQPAVVGEIIGGILLGPTLLGQLPGNPTERLFPPEVQPFLKVVADLGLIIFMFIVGLELDLALIRGKERVAAVISLTSVALPFGLGVLLSLALYTTYGVVDEASVDKLAFALFIGASMAVTAFPVLARILSERGMHRTEVGALALACAAVDDILAWSLLALVVAIAAAGSLLDLPVTFGLSLAFIAFMFVVVKPVLVKVNDAFRREGRLTPAVLSIVLVGILLSSYATSKIGIHAIFGAFLFGVVMPRTDAAGLTHSLLERLEGVSVVLLLPVFFIVTGLSVNVPGIDPTGFLFLLLILAVACAGKFIGASAAARAQGLAGRKAAAIGILMNTRGLTELVILNIGLTTGVLSEQLFTLLVLMAVLTTVMTEPLLRLVYPDRILQRDIEEAEKAALGEEAAYRVVVPVDDPTTAGLSVLVAADIARSESPSEVVLVRFLSQPEQLELGTGLGSELALMTESLDALHRLAEQAEVRQARTAVESQFTDDLAHDLQNQLHLIEPELIVVDRAAIAPASGGFGPEDVQATLLSGLCDLGLVIQRGEPSQLPGTPGSVVGIADESTSGGAVVEHAARLAATWRAPLVVTTPGEPSRKLQREVEEAVDRLRSSYGLDAASSDRPLDEVAANAALVVVALGEIGALEQRVTAALGDLASGITATVLAIAARDSIAREGAVQRLAKWQAVDRSATGDMVSAGQGEEGE